MAITDTARELATGEGTDEAYVLEEQVGFVLRRANQRHVAIFAEAIGELGLTPTQFSALVKIRDEGQVAQNRLGRLTSMDPANILGVVQRLVQRGLVDRQPAPDDLRSTLLRLTPAGAALVAAAIPRAREATGRTLHPLTPTKRKELLRLLEKLVE